MAFDLCGQGFFANSSLSVIKKMKKKTSFILGLGEERDGRKTPADSEILHIITSLDIRYLSLGSTHWKQFSIYVFTKNI
jgi:hypothetical protein